MAKTLVISSGDQRQRSGNTKGREPGRVPFLRGILTRSIQDAGLSFDDAYKLASTIRDELSDTSKISTNDLRAKVTRHLKKSFSVEVQQRYLIPTSSPATVLVRDAEGQFSPFSRGLHRHHLESCGLSAKEATTVTEVIADHLTKRGVAEISSRHLGHMIYRYLRWKLGPYTAQRYLVWMDFVHRNPPLLLLVGGAPGCGKSTIATELANRLGIVRTQSTDMLREVMRMMIPQRLMPVLHTSSFMAWQELPSQRAAGSDSNALLADGYRTQAELLSVAGEAVVNRALKEKVSMILEGVHVHPLLLEKITAANTDVVVVPIMLAILRPEQLRMRFRGRGKLVPDRRAERYLEHFDAIWRLQTYLLSEADRWEVPIIPNDDREKAIRQIMATAMDALSQDFSHTPEEVFI